MLGILRWTGKGESYRTVQRFFDEEYEWSKWRWLLNKPPRRKQRVFSVEPLRGLKLVISIMRHKWRGINPPEIKSLGIKA